MTVALLRAEAGPYPNDRGLRQLVGDSPRCDPL
ncbi:hypothetical protein ACFZDI_12810 [Streptomyces sp. NPDC007907]